MSVLVMDSFDWNGNTIIANRYLSATGSFSNTQTKHGAGYALYCNYQNVVYDIGDQSGNIIIVGAYIYISALSAITNIFRAFTTTGSPQCSLRLNTSRQLQVVRLSTVLGTGSQVLQIGVWYHIEWMIKVTNSLSTGECVVNVDGVQDINITSGDTQQQITNSLGQCYLGAGGIGSQIYFDDFYVLDTSGSYADDFIGPYIRMECLEPNGNGNYNGFDGSDGNQVDNYLLVDEAPADDDTTYVESSNVDERDTYTFDNISGSPNEIMAVQTMTRHKKDASGSRTVKHCMYIDSTDYDGSVAHALSDGVYENDVEVWIEDPDSSAQWTETGVNGLDAGIKIET